MSPTISVVMTAYNGAEFILDSLESVFGQTRSPDEVIVVNDGSTDDTPRLLRAYDGRIELIEQHNRGVCAAANRGIAACRCEFVAFASQDDLWEPRKLEWQLEVLAADPEIDILVGHMLVFGQLTGEFRRPPGCGRLDRDALRRAQFDRSYLATPTVVVRRALFERIGDFREDLPAEDFEFWLRALRADAVFHYDPRPVVRYRAHDGNSSRREWLMHETHYGVLREYAGDIDDHELVARVLARNRLTVARHRLAAGQLQPAQRAFAASFRHRPAVSSGAWALALRDPRLTRLMYGLTRLRRGACR